MNAVAIWFHFNIDGAMNEEKQSPVFTIRDEANALTLLAFRNGLIEQLHAGRHDPVVDDPEVSRITNEAM